MWAANGRHHLVYEQLLGVIADCRRRHTRRRVAIDRNARHERDDRKRADRVVLRGAE